MSKNKRDVLFLCQFFYPEYISSATLPFDTAKALVKAGFTVDVMCGEPKEYSAEKGKVPKKEAVDGIDIKRISYLQPSRKSVVGRIINYFSFTISMMGRFLSMKNYKAIIVYSNPPMLPVVAAWAKKIWGTKLIFVAYDLYPELAIVSNSIRNSSFIEKIFNYINKQVYENANKVVSLSNEMKEYITAHRSIEDNQVIVIPNWYKDELPNGENNNTVTLFDDIKDKFVVSYFGNMGTIQDIETIIKTIRMTKEDESIHFLFAGHGNKQQYLKEVIQTEKLKNVTVFDFLRGDEYKKALEISSCAIVSIIPNATGLCVPSKTYGYMMQGLPLLVIMDESDIVADAYEGAGIHIKNNNASELVEAIRYLRENPEMLKDKGEKSREIFLKKYTMEICTQKYVELFEEIINDECRI